ncbi:MAG: hypothetical protein PVF47_05510 [Anaerolineae bacterium]
MSNLNVQDARRLVAQLRASTPHDACWSCDCFQGFLVQVKLDGSSQVAQLVDPLLAPPGEMHGCLGCDPCPAADLYADYLRRRQASGRSAGSVP